MTGRNLSPHSQGSWAGPTEAAVTYPRTPKARVPHARLYLRFSKIAIQALPSELPWPAPGRMVVEHRHGIAPRTLLMRHRLWQ